MQMLGLLLDFDEVYVLICRTFHVNIVHKS